MTTRTVAVELIGKFSGYVGAVRTGIAATRDLGGELDKMRLKSSESYQHLQAGATAAGLALAALSGWAIKSSMEFDKQMSAVRAVSGATGAEMDVLRTKALDAGKVSVFSATQAAEAETELARAGLNAAQIAGGALAGSLSLAAAGQLELADAATVTVQAMTIFGLKASDVGHIADVLAAGANASVTDVHSLALAMQMAGVALHQFGVPLEEGIGTLAMFAQNAMRGSDAGTSLKMMLLQLVTPSTKAKDLMVQLGINAFDAQGNFIGLAKFADVLQQSLGGLTQEQRQSAMGIIFGSDAMRSANVLYAEGAKGVEEWTAKVNDQGAAARTASTMTDNLSGDIKKLRGQLDAMFIESGEGASSGLRVVSQALDHLVATFGALPGPVKEAIVILAGVAGATLLVSAGMLKMHKTTADTFAAMRSGGPVMNRMADGLQFTTKWLGRAAAAFAILEVAQTVFQAAIRPTDVNGLTDSLMHLGESGEKSGEMLNVFGKNMDGLKQQAQGLTAGWLTTTGTKLEGLPGIGGLVEDINHWATGSSFTEAKQHFQEIDAALANMARGDHAVEARKAFAQIVQMTGLTVEQAAQLFPTYTNAMAEATRGTGMFGEAASEADQRNQALDTTLNDLITHGQTLTQVWETLVGAMVNSDHAALAAKQAIAGLGKTFKDNKYALDQNTIAGLANKTALEDAAKLAIESAQAYYDQTGDLAGAVAMMKAYEDAAVKATGATGKNKKAVQDLADTLYALPAQKTVTVNVDFKVSAKDQADLGGDINLFKHHHAMGGADAPGWNMYGENGPEAHWSNGAGGGYTVPAAQTASMLSSGRSSPAVYVSVHVDPIDGRVRNILMKDAQGRAVPAAQVSAAYP